jgi:ethanolamine utilization protein EutP (predicted NTPase)
MTELQNMTITQLKLYISKHRREEAEFSAALRELLNRDSNAVIYPADMPVEEVERVMREKIEQTQKADE